MEASANGNGAHGQNPCPCRDIDISAETFCAHGWTKIENKTGAVSTPIVLSSTFAHPDFNHSSGFDYSRRLNPTRLELEQTVAALEHTDYCLAFSSGMASISTWVKQFVPGDHVLVSEDLYGGTWRMFNHYSRYGIRFEFIDTSDKEKILASIKPETKALFIETPSNPMMRITDIKFCADIIHKNGGTLCVDNTFLSPYLQQPKKLGADFIVHSGTKYLGGHNDVIAGFLCYSGESNDEFFRVQAMSEGAALSPFDSWLVLRGIKTLPLRMDRSCDNAEKIADFLRIVPSVEKVFFAGYALGEDLEVQKSQSKRFGAMISFFVKDERKVPEILSRFKVISFAESPGGVQSLITYPATQTHNSIPKDLRERVGVNDKLLRLSVGIENVDELIADLEQAIR